MVSDADWCRALSRGRKGRDPGFIIVSSLEMCTVSLIWDCKYTHTHIHTEWYTCSLPPILRDNNVFYTVNSSPTPHPLPSQSHNCMFISPWNETCMISSTFGEGQQWSWIWVGTRGVWLTIDGIPWSVLCVGRAWFNISVPLTAWQNHTMPFICLIHIPYFLWDIRVCTYQWY